MTVSEIREQLKQLYNSFIEKFGSMNLTRNKRVIMKDPDGFRVLASLEVRQSDSTYTPADVLTRSNKTEAVKFQSDDPVECLGYVLGMTGKVDLEMICTICDKEKHEVLMELGELVFWEPMKNIWVTNEKWLSGNVVRKLQESEQLCIENNCHDEIKRSIRAIKEVQPNKILWELLYNHLNLGERWINCNMYAEFANWLFDSNGISVQHFQSTDTYKVINKGWTTAKISREFYVKSKGRVSMDGTELLENAMVNTTPYFTYTVDGEKLADTDAIQLAADKIDQIRQKFTEWLEQLPQVMKDDLMNKYNQIYNCYVLRKYNGSHLQLPGIDMEGLERVYGITEIRDAQKDGIWRLIQECGGIIDWEVGTGKSILQICSAYEMKRMGIRNKPTILCLKANVADLVKLYRTAYPQGKLLAPTEQDFEKVNRQRLFHEIKNNDWDCIIMTHDQFGKIPQSSELQREIITEEVAMLEADLREVKNAGRTVSRTMQKGLEQRRAALNVRLKIVQDHIEKGKDRGVEFDEMGIDHIFIDESQKYKNLQFVTRHNRVAGLGNQQGSQKAMNMLFAIRTLQKRFNSDIQCTFLSGTPISNSLTEMYLLFKYLRPNELHRQQIENFDSWAAVFAKKTTDFEFSVTNQIQAKERFRHFIKVPELALFYNEIADYRTNKSINIDRPEMVEQLVPLVPSADQKEFVQSLIMYAKTGDGSHIGRYDLVPGGPGDTARMLIATNYAKKMSTDMRLIDPDLYTDNPGNKISICAMKVKEFHTRFSDDKGVQLVFCDLGVPDKKTYTDEESGEQYKKWTVYEALRTKLVEEYKIPVSQIAFIHDYNEKTRNKLFRQVNAGEIRILIGSTDKAGTGVNVQERVVAIHDLDIPWKPAELEQRGGRGARQGNWLAKLKQDNKVYRYIYATEQSLDTYKFTLLKNKQTFISQMKTNELQVRSIDEGSFDEATGMNFAEYVAILSGDNTLLEKAKIDKKLAVLENLKQAHYRESHNNKYLLEHKTNRLVEVQAMVDLTTRDTELYETNMTRGEDGVKDNPLDIPALREQIAQLEIEEKSENMKMEMDKQSRKLLRSLKMSASEDKVVRKEFPDIATIQGLWLQEKFKSWTPKMGEVRQLIGVLYGFNLYIERENQNDEAMINIRRAMDGSNQIVFANKLYPQHPEGGLKYQFNNGIPSRDNAKLASRIFLNGLDRCNSIRIQYVNERDRLVTDIESLSTVQSKPFGRDQEIDQLRLESRNLEKLINDKISGKAAVAEMVKIEYKEVVPVDDNLPF